MLNFKNVTINDTKDLVYIYNLKKATYLIKNDANFVSVGMNKICGRYYMAFLKTQATSNAIKKYKEEFAKSTCDEWTF